MPTPILYFSLYFFMLFFTSNGIQLIVVNNCKEPIWPAILGNSGHQTLNSGGFPLSAAEKIIVNAPKWWSGRMWARQGCCFDQTGSGECETGGCNGQLRCMGSSGAPPATVVEMTLGTPTNPSHYYDVSLIDGFNLPVAMIPVGGGGAGCGVAACEADVNACCPEELAVRKEGRVVGCKSACLAVGDDKYCCTGKYGSSSTCKETMYSKVFKNVCPRAYSYAYDEESGLKSCMAKRYLITFCPPN